MIERRSESSPHTTPLFHHIFPSPRPRLGEGGCLVPPPGASRPADANTIPFSSPSPWNRPWSDWVGEARALPDRR